jgi:hypothetical protein
MTVTIGRRELLAALGGAVVAWPLAARAQQSERTRHVAILMSGAESDPETQARLAGIRQGLSRFGWSEGRNVEIDYRYASASAEQARLLARDLVALKPEVIVAPSVVVATALQRETRAIPIVSLLALAAHQSGRLRSGTGQLAGVTDDTAMAVRPAAPLSAPRRLIAVAIILLVVLILDGMSSLPPAADAPHPLGLLRARGERPSSHRSAEPHSREESPRFSRQTP